MRKFVELTEVEITAVAGAYKQREGSTGVMGYKQREGSTGVMGYKQREGSTGVMG